LWKQIVSQKAFKLFLERRVDQITMIGRGERPESDCTDELHGAFGKNFDVEMTSATPIGCGFDSVTRSPNFGASRILARLRRGSISEQAL
jgi:hypothetical protein